jgi:hypothetical protein
MSQLADERFCPARARTSSMSQLRTKQKTASKTIILRSQNASVRSLVAAVVRFQNEYKQTSFQLIVKKNIYYI